MQNFYLIDFFKKNEIIAPDLLDSLKCELDQNIYYYGDQFKYPRESNFKKSFKTNIRKLLIRLYALYRIVQNRKIPDDKKSILSSAYFSINQELKKFNYQVYCPSWQIKANDDILSDLNLFVSSEKIKSKFQNGNFNELVSPEFLSEIKEFEEKLKIVFIKKKINALIVSHDVGFFEKISIRICKEIGIPSFIFLHGLPGRYNNIDENRSDYLVVWGEQIKKNYIKAGINPDKIFVSGHPYYKDFKMEELKFSLESILVITKSMPGGQHSDEVRLSDRGNMVLYLYSLENVLRGIGVKSVRFRPHPSESSKWYLKFINKDFYKADTGSLKESIEKSTLIIGPTSTVFLESLYFGVNYVIYEPAIDNIDLINCEPVPPFDGTDPRIPFARNEKELEYILKNKEKIDISFFSEYIKTSFDLSCIKNII